MTFSDFGKFRKSVDFCKSMWYRIHDKVCSGHGILLITPHNGRDYITKQPRCIRYIQRGYLFVCEAPYTQGNGGGASLGYLSDKARYAEPTQKSPPSLSVISSSRVLTVSRKNGGGIQTANAVVVYILPSAGLNCTGLLPVGDVTKIILPTGDEKAGRLCRGSTHVTNLRTIPLSEKFQNRRIFYRQQKTKHYF